MAQRVSNDATLALGEGTPKQRVSLDAAIALGEGSPKSHISSLVILVLADVPPGATPNAYCYEFVSPPS